MPTITYSDEEKSALNAIGAERKCRCCPVCGDSMHWKAFHNTVYFEGVITEGKVSWKGMRGVSALCEECWTKLTPEQRLPHYHAICDGSKKLVKSVRPLANRAGGFRPHPQDQERFNREHATIEELRKLFVAAVMEGK